MSEKYNKKIYSVLRDASCSRGWLRWLVQLFFGLMIVSSFTLILLMSLKSRPLRSTSSRCRETRCRVICYEAPYFGEFENEILETTWQAGANCPNIILTLNRPYFENSTLPQSWLSGIRTNIRELAIIGGNLKHIPTRSFMSQFSNNLDSLILEDIQISTWEPDTFVGLSCLRKLYIKNSFFINITRAALQAVDDTLEFLDIKGSSKWNPDNITGSAEFIRLNTVDFSLNPFYNVLDRSSFSQLQMCKILYLNSCRISSLGIGTFDFLESIEKLYLNDNYLIVIPHELFEKIIPLQPRIFLQNNLWYCNCSNTALRVLSDMDILVVDPICNYPDNINGLTFSEFNAFCKNDENYNNTTDVDRHEKCDVASDDPKLININGLCYETHNCSHKGFAYGCNFSRINLDKVTRTMISKNRSIIEDSSWLSIRYAMRSSQATMVELFSKSTPGQGLIWFQSACPHKIYCVNTMPKILRVFDKPLGSHYTFCPFDLRSHEISSNLCVSCSLDFDITFVYSRDYRMIIIGFTFLSLICLICGAICIYAVIHRNPHLLKGSKRILFVKHKEINALILPPQIPVRKDINPDVTHEVDRKIFYVSTQEENVSKLQRSASFSCPNSNEVSYISAIQPTDEQLALWRNKQIGLKSQYKSLTSDIYQFTSRFDTDSLPYYSLNEKNYEKPLEVTKK